MPNPFFRFKQFTVHQERGAMKVCTDSCLFGAWLAGKQLTAGKTNALDIGTGTGLLSLMLAQQHDVQIDAVEIDEDAARQAAANFEASPWKKRLTVHCMPVQQFSAQSHSKYDLIFSNPPFFEYDLKSDDPLRNVAMHSEALPLQGLLRAVQERLADHGRFAVLLPYHRSGYFKEMCGEAGLCVTEEVSVRQTTGHDCFRSMLLFEKEPAAASFQSISIKHKGTDQYTAAFTALLEPYYLYL